MGPVGIIGTVLCSADIKSIKTARSSIIKTRFVFKESLLFNRPYYSLVKNRSSFLEAVDSNTSDKLGDRRKRAKKKRLNCGFDICTKPQGYILLIIQF